MNYEKLFEQVLRELELNEIGDTYFLIFSNGKKRTYSNREAAYRVINKAFDNGETKIVIERTLWDGTLDKDETKILVNPQQNPKK